MRRLVMLALLWLVTGCSATFSTQVDDFSVPISNTFEEICWVQVDASGAPPISAATYRAQATYDSTVSVTESVKVQFFGRADNPGSDCTPPNGNDTPLSGVYELARKSSQPIEIGGGEFGRELGRLVEGGTFWLGATAAHNFGFGEELRFTDGRISVVF